MTYPKGYEPPYKPKPKLPAKPKGTLPTEYKPPLKDRQPEEYKPPVSPTFPKGHIPLYKQPYSSSPPKRYSPVRKLDKYRLGRVIFYVIGIIIIIIGVPNLVFFSVNGVMTFVLAIIIGIIIIGGAYTKFR